MKKLATLLIAAGLVFGATAPAANAIDFKAKGEWVMSFDYGQNGNFTGGHGQTGYGKSNEDEFEARQRVRLQLDAVASENLSGTVFFEIGNTRWGSNSADNGGGALGADGTIVEVRRAYIDWMVPNTELKVRMGLQGMELPSFAMKKSQVFVDDVAGITLSYQFTDNVGATLFWARPYNDNFSGSQAGGKYSRNDVNSNFMDNVDVFGLTIPLTFDGIKVTPWGIIAAIGPNAFGNDVFNDDGSVVGYDNFGNYVGTSAAQMRAGLLPAWGVAGTKGPHANEVKLDQYATAWWAGLTADITYFDPFRIALDFMGGGVSWDDSRLNRAGWMVALLLEYKLDWGIPGLVAWYASGDNSNLGDGSERMPYLSLGNGDNDFSYYAYDGHPGIAREGVLGSSMTGTWGVGLRVKDVSFIEDLKHTLRVNLIGGTNDHKIFKQLAKHGAANDYNLNDSTWGLNGVYLTDQDTVLEIGLHNEYKMYENFTIMLDGNYMALWLADTKYKGVRRTMTGVSSETRDAWNINVSFVYSF